jgi:hypothetical protein
MDSLITDGIKPAQLRGTEKQTPGAERDWPLRRKRPLVPDNVPSKEEPDQDLPGHALDDLA